MKKFLPGFLIVVFAIVVVIFPQIAAAQQPPAQQTQQAPAQAGQAAPATGTTGRTPPPDGLWVADPEVTFIGKNAARSGNLLDWTLRNYNWVCVKQAQTNANKQYQCDDSDNPLAHFWLLIVSFIVVPLLFVVILATSIVIIITRGKSLTIMKFIPRFVAVIVLIVFSYSLLQFLYQFTDVIQGFFLRSDSAKICPPNCISQKDLLYVGWKYEDFVGLRLLHDYYAESAFMSLLLTKLTALTYFVMVGILLMRKIILWFFIIVSPIFPLLLLYYPVRNTGKIWIGEFFRWLLYAPLFAMFLNGLVYMWRQQIPLSFIPPQGVAAVNDKAQIIYPTAVNILLGGPKQFVTPDNSVNLTETFALYVVALIMLWVVILLPWILLQIFLDYASNFSPGESAVMKTLVSLAGNKKGGGGGGGGTAMPIPGGSAISLPFTKKFQLPTSLSPAGAAKEIANSMKEVNNASTQEAKTTNFQTATFGNVNFTPAAQLNAQVLSVANVSTPTLRDIARYDASQYSRDTSKQSEVNLARETLEKIANPVAVTNTVEREKYSDIRDKLTQESQQGNILATTILNAANSSVQSQSSNNISTSQLQSILTQISSSVSAASISTVSSASSTSSATSSNVGAGAGASSTEKTSTSASSVVNREKMSQLKDMLSHESKENNNQLAQSLMSVSEKTSSSEIEKLKDTLIQASAQGDRMAQNVMSQISSINKQAQATQQVKTVLQQVNNPASSSSPVDRQKLTKLQESLSKASKEGNDLATAVLKVTDKTSAADIEKIQEKINKARAKGEPLATELGNLTAAKAAAPVVNRVQTVSKEDYDAVRSMWKENYNNLEIPQGMAGNRSEWIKDDINKIDKIISQLSSTDQEKVKQGMDEVGGLMPFLLMGGFSQTEIVSYLKAKQDAGKDVIASIAAEEETQVSVGTQAAHAEKTMAATLEGESSSSTSPTVSSSSSSAPDEEASPLASINTSTTTITNPTVSSTVSNDILAMVDLKLPKMRDVVRYDTSRLAKDTSKFEDIKKMHSVLENISNPAAISDVPTREKFQKLRDKLLEESQKGNPTAQTILSAASSTAVAKGAQPASDVKATLEKLANPELITSPEDKEQAKKLHDELAKAKDQGNPLAASLLAVTPTTPMEEVEKLSNQLKEAKQKGEPLATSVVSKLDETTVIPTSNRIQEVSPEEFEEVKKLWTENYQTLELPAEFGADVKGRLEWIKHDMTEIQKIIDLLVSDDAEKKKEGVQKVNAILPFLLLGGYSLPEMVAYLKAKYDAAKDAIAKIEEEESKKVAVPVNGAAEEKPKEAAAEEKKE